MKVLLPSSVDQVFTREQADALAKYCEVDTSFDAFWGGNGQYDIIQLNWPEELTQWREPTDIELVFLRRRLTELRTKSHIVVTRHNFHPHFGDTERYRELYDIVYSAAHAVIHMGSFSVQEYLSRYAAHHFLAEQVQTVIPHPIFSSYPDTVTRSEARAQLGLKPKAFALLAFGRVNSGIEKNIVVDAFFDLPVKNRVAIVPGWTKTQGEGASESIQVGSAQFVQTFST